MLTVEREYWSGDIQHGFGLSAGLAEAVCGSVDDSLVMCRGGATGLLLAVVSLEAPPNQESRNPTIVVDMGYLEIKKWGS